jgi:3D (Asp-Asp-Asp) domain-containing protein
VVVALLVWVTVLEPSRGMTDGVACTSPQAPPMTEVLWFLWARRSFRHLCLAAALHSVVWYASGAFNNAFLQRSHQLSVAQAGYWIGVFSLVAGIGTFLGGYLADWISVRMNDRRWYLWVPGIATLLCVPFQFMAYLSPTMATAVPSFAGLMLMAAVFFGPSFAMTQRIKSATRRARFVEFHHPQACDVRVIPLMAFRTIAVDREKIKMGTVMYVPKLRGKTFWNAGEFFTHDGYVIASDTGGAIEDNHIDMFVADAAVDPFPDIVRSNPRGTFDAYFVDQKHPAAVALKDAADEVCKDTDGPGRKRRTANPV